MVSVIYKAMQPQYLRVDAINTDALNPKASYGFIPGLDGLRALSVLVVLMAHLGLHHIVPGGFGVTVFFFISGFLITRLLIAEKESLGKVNLPQFFARRLIRLYPALLFMLCATVAISNALGYGLPTPTEMLAAVFYFTNFYQVHATNMDYLPLMSWKPLWSLSVEEHFYLLFPLLVMLCGRGWNKLRYTVMVIIVAVPLWRMFQYLNYNGSVADYNYMSTFARIDGIAWGCLLTISLHQNGVEGFRRVIGMLPLALATLALLATFIIRDDMFRWVLRFSVQGATIFVLLLNLYYLASLRWVFKILDFAPLVWIGMTSYALYLWHFPIYDYVHRAMDVSVVSILLTLALSFLMTAFSFYCVERPFMKLRKKFGSYVPKRVPVAAL